MMELWWRQCPEQAGAAPAAFLQPGETAGTARVCGVEGGQSRADD